MLILQCDLCVATKKVMTSHAIPSGWSEITISGYVQDPKEKYGKKLLSLKKSLCPDCIPKIFNFAEDAPKTIQEQFEIAAVDYMTELATEAVECAIDETVR